MVHYEIIKVSEEAFILEDYIFCLEDVIIKLQALMSMIFFHVPFKKVIFNLEKREYRIQMKHYIEL
jgi:hypothetical protein